MSHAAVELDEGGLLERGNDRGIPFETGWKKCHTQNCRLVSGDEAERSSGVPV